ncbi:MAG TPA: GTPase ObgE [Clostridia bacterium]|jgi:GTP-binding protein|nr:GTPase ObgE [Clostridia bacterium]HHY06837.1 GTPase ObgE [Clostridia bacterium]
MFYDYTKIYVKGGDGGKGMVSFRREKYVPEGGPSGGDGGQGGSVILQVAEGLHTLADFHFQRHFKAERGENGKAKNMHGANGSDLLVKVPVGTVVRLAGTKEVIADLASAGQQFIVARGGRGGKGNARFVSSVNRAPRIAENGDLGEEKWIELELKLLADVGLIGFPNVGKSTIIAHVSAAKPKIANYHFTTLHPHLGVVSLGPEKSFVLVDIPGLIEGASEGVGLGHRFLRHVERTRLLLHVLDIAGSEGRDPCQDFTVINKELEKYNPYLKNRPQIIVANKMDLSGAEENLVRLKKELGTKYEIYPVSAVTGEGLKELMFRTGELLATLPITPLEVSTEEFRLVKVEKEEPYQVELQEGIWEVYGPEIERLLRKMDLNYEDNMERFLLILRQMGVEDTLREKGAQDGDTVSISGWEFDFLD